MEAEEFIEKYLRSDTRSSAFRLRLKARGIAFRTEFITEQGESHTSIVTVADWEIQFIFKRTQPIGHVIDRIEPYVPEQEQEVPPPP